jgi:hypothetical protein
MYLILQFPFLSLLSFWVSFGIGRLSCLRILDGAIECIGGIEYIEEDWMNYGEFTGFGETSMSTSVIETSSVGGGGRGANSTVEFNEIVFRCHREDGRESAVRLVDNMNRGAGGFADMVFMG